MNDESLVDFNFWPSFADLMLATVFVLVLVLFLVAFAMQRGSANMTPIRESQRRIINSIAEAYGVGSPATGNSSDSVKTPIRIPIGRDSLSVQTSLTTQRITFSSSVLFPKAGYALNAQGQSVMRTVGRALEDEITSIKSIQIQGHTDTDPTGTTYESNMHLGAYRAINVFLFLKNEAEIDPARRVMSISSFGEYMPVQRDDDGASYNPKQLALDNSTSVKKERNRRIELLLSYGNGKGR